MSEMLLEVLKMLKFKNRLHINNVVYLCCGALEFICIVFLISPFKISFTFVEKILWNHNLSDNSVIIQVSFWMIIMRSIIFLLRKLIVRKFDQKSNREIRNVYGNVYAIDDVSEFICSLVLFVFMSSVFFQIYHTGILFISKKTCFIYVVILLRVFDILLNCFKAKNIKAIDEVLRKYPDFD